MIGAFGRDPEKKKKKKLEIHRSFASSSRFIFDGEERKTWYIPDNFSTHWSMLVSLIREYFVRKICQKIRFIEKKKEKVEKSRLIELILIQIFDLSYVAPSFRKLLVFTFDIFIYTSFHFIEKLWKIRLDLIYIPQGIFNYILISPTFSLIF